MNMYSRDIVHQITGKGSEIAIHLNTPHHFNVPYEIGFKRLYTHNSILNVVKGVNNCFRILYPVGRKPYLDVELNDGAYEISDIIAYIQTVVKETNYRNKNDIAEVIRDNKRMRGKNEDEEVEEDEEDIALGEKRKNAINEVREVEAKKPESRKPLSIGIKLEKSTLRVKLSCNYPIDFTPKNSIGSLLGFLPQVLAKDVKHYSLENPNITNVNCIRICCNIAQGQYLNGKLTHCIHDFYPKVGVGEKIIEKQIETLYFPIALQSINSIIITLEDQNENRIKCKSDEVVTVVVHLRAMR